MPTLLDAPLLPLAAGFDRCTRTSSPNSEELATSPMPVPATWRSRQSEREPAPVVDAGYTPHRRRAPFSRRWGASGAVLVDETAYDGRLPIVPGSTVYAVIRRSRDMSGLIWMARCGGYRLQMAVAYGSGPPRCPVQRSLRQPDRHGRRDRRRFHPVPNLGG